MRIGTHSGRPCRTALVGLALCVAVPAFGVEVVRDVVAYYGVDPADAKPGVDAAIASARAYLVGHPADTLVLNFPAGIYQFHHPTAWGMDLRNFAGGKLVVRGAGTGATTLVFDQFDQIAIYILNSDFVTLEQMHLTRAGNAASGDLWGLYTSQGEVTEVAKGRIRFRVHDGFPDPKWLFDTAGTSNERTLLVFRGPDLDPELDPKADKIMVGDRSGNGSMVDLGGGLYDAMLANPNLVPNVVVGERVALKTKVGAQTIRIFGSDDCTIQDVLITRAAGNPIRMPYGGNNLIVRRLVVDRAEPISGRAPFFSGPGGGIQLYATDTGPLVEDCVVVGTADDGIALFSDNPNQLATNSIVRRNIVRDNQARGILITHTDGGICEDNTLIRSHDVSIRFQIESSAEGVTNASVKNWMVRNNTLIQPWTAATFRFVNECTVSGLHDNNTIASNIILQASKNCNVVQLESVDHVTVYDNEILSFSTEEDTQIWKCSDALVQIRQAVSFSGSNNVYSGSIGSRAIIEQLDPTTALNFEWRPRSTLRIPASEDAFVDSKSPDRNQGATAFMKTDNGAARQWMGLVKFNVAGIPADYRVVSTKLRIMPSNFFLPVETPQVYACPDNSWAEMSVAWSNRPVLGNLLESIGRKFVAGNLIEFDLSSTVAGNGTFSFYLHNASGGSNSQYATRENGLYLAPELVMETAPVNAAYSAWIAPFATGGATGLPDNPDGDALDNLAEYGLGGDPDNPNDPAIIFPTFGKTEDDALEYVYRRRRDYAARGLAYGLERTDALVSNVWTNEGFTIEGTTEVDVDFDAVTNRLSIDGKTAQSIRLRIGVE